jgi:hypothetical protein
MRTWPWNRSIASLKSRPGSLPCVTAFAASSAVTAQAASDASLPYGTPQAASCWATRRRARRAPRPVLLRRIVNRGVFGGAPVCASIDFME